MKHKVFLENEKIYLRAVEPTDLEIMYHIENNPSLWEITNFTVPYSRYILKQYIEHSSYDIYTDKQLRLMIVQKTDNSIVGVTDITDFDPLHGRGAIGVVVNESCRNQGYAKQALKLLIEYSFEFLHMKQLYAYIAVDNRNSVKLFQACGFEESGLLKDWVRVGDIYKDVLVMQCISSN